MYRMEKFSDFIVEQKDEAYKLIVFNNSNEDVRDVGKRTRPDFKLLVDSAKKVGIQIPIIAIIIMLKEELDEFHPKYPNIITTKKCFKNSNG